jgi:hypothetical protein
MLILLPTFIVGGWPAVWQPVGWHLDRQIESGTLLGFLDASFGKRGLGWLNSIELMPLFTLLGFSGVLLVFLKRLMTIRKLLLASILTMILFILFTRIFSPQWWLWILPFLILTIENKMDVVLIILYDLLDYAAFPLVYDMAGIDSPAYLLVTGLLLGIMLIFFVRTARKLCQEERRELA